MRPPLRLPSRRQARRQGTEYGGNVQENTVQPKEQDALTAAEKMRLMRLTGSERVDAAPDGGEAFRGFVVRRRRRRHRPRW